MKVWIYHQWFMWYREHSYSRTCYFAANIGNEKWHSVFDYEWWDKTHYADHCFRFFSFQFSLVFSVAYVRFMLDISIFFNFKHVANTPPKHHVWISPANCTLQLETKTSSLLYTFIHFFCVSKFVNGVIFQSICKFGFVNGANGITTDRIINVLVGFLVFIY